MKWQQTWAELTPAWREAYLLAWDSYQAGSIGVGAVVVDAAGEVIGRGRNRSGEPAETPGVLAGTYLAHAEVNALATLAPGDYWDHAVFTTLEPCLLCTAAATHAHVGRVAFAARDPLWNGIERLPELNPHIARRFHERHHLDLGPLTLWAGGLAKASRALQLMKRDGIEIDSAFASDPALAVQTSEEPAQAELARTLISQGTLPGDGTELEAALARTWDDLEAYEAAL